MKAVFIRELQSHSISYSGIVYRVLFLFISGIIFTAICITGNVCDFRSLFETLSIYSIFLIPLLLFDSIKEKKNGSVKLLLSSPISTTEIVLAKYLAALCYALLIAAFILVYLPIADIYGKINFDEILPEFISFILLLSVFVSITCFITALTKNTISLYIASVISLLSLYAIHLLSGVIHNETLLYIMESISVFSAFKELVSGIFSISSVIRLISVSGAFIFATRIAYEIHYRKGNTFQKGGISIL